MHQLAVEGNIFGEVVRGHQYSVGQVCLFVESVLSGCAPMRCAVRVLEVFWQRLFGSQVALEQTPHWSTGRLWLLRLGHYKLTRPKPRADDWVWMVDHTNQIGVEKCLIILGIRLIDLPAAGQPLRHEDMELIELAPTPHPKKEVVFQQLQVAVAKTGVPRVILEDNGADLHGGVRMFLDEHPETCAIYDIKHKAACLLKGLLEKDPIWKDFCRQVGQTKFQVQQTELAFLVPPSQRSKARYMNVGELVDWGRKTLELLKRPPKDVLQHTTRVRLEEKFGWLRAFDEPLSEWFELLSVIQVTEDHVRRQGLTRNTPNKLALLLDSVALRQRGQYLRDNLLSFVRHESWKAHVGERLPGTTEVLESCIGKLKSLERDQHKSGLTGLLLGLGAIVSEATAEVVRSALESSPTKAVLQWCHEKLGPTVQSKRKTAYATVDL